MKKPPHLTTGRLHIHIMPINIRLCKDNKTYETNDCYTFSPAAVLLLPEDNSRAEGHYYTGAH